jgi:hypothetical protein
MQRDGPSRWPPGSSNTTGSLQTNTVAVQAKTSIVAVSGGSRCVLEKSQIHDTSPLFSQSPLAQIAPLLSGQDEMRLK